MTITVLLLLGGVGNRFQDIYQTPKPMIQVKGESQLYWATKGAWLSYKPENVIFAVRTPLLELVKGELNRLSFLENYEVVDIGYETNGAAETASRALINSTSLDLDSNLVIADNDCFNLNSSFEESSSNNFPFVSVTQSNNPQHCFVEFNSEMCATAFFEKQIHGKFALSGHYGFSSSWEFRIAYGMFLKSGEIEGEFFLSGLMQFLTQIKHVRVFPVEKYFSLGTPVEISNVHEDIVSYR
jgi:hypothetical protein